MSSTVNEIAQAIVLELREHNIDVLATQLAECKHTLTQWGVPMDEQQLSVVEGIEYMHNKLSEHVYHLSEALGLTKEIGQASEFPGPYVVSQQGNHYVMTSNGGDEIMRSSNSNVSYLICNLMNAAWMNNQDKIMN